MEDLEINASQIPIKCITLKHSKLPSPSPMILSQCEETLEVFIYHNFKPISFPYSLLTTLPFDILRIFNISVFFFNLFIFSVLGL